MYRILFEVLLTIVHLCHKKRTRVWAAFYMAASPEERLLAYCFCKGGPVLLGAAVGLGGAMVKAQCFRADTLCRGCFWLWCQGEETHPVLSFAGAGGVVIFVRWTSYISLKQVTLFEGVEDVWSAMLNRCHRFYHVVSHFICCSFIANSRRPSSWDLSSIDIHDPQADVETVQSTPNI